MCADVCFCEVNTGQQVQYLLLVIFRYDRLLCCDITRVRVGNVGGAGHVQFGLCSPVDP